MLSGGFYYPKHYDRTTKILSENGVAFLIQNKENVIL